MTWNEDDDRKEKEISEILLRADDEGSKGQQAASEAGKLEDIIPSIKTGESGITVDKNEGEQEEKKAPQKEATWADLTKTKPEEGGGIVMNTPPRDKFCLLDPLGRTKRKKAVTKAGSTQNEPGGDEGNTADPRGDG